MGLLDKLGGAIKGAAAQVETVAPGLISRLAPQRVARAVVDQGGETKSAPDGYTLLMGSNALLAINPSLYGRPLRLDNRGQAPTGGRFGPPR